MSRATSTARTTAPKMNTSVQFQSGFLTECMETSATGIGCMETSTTQERRGDVHKEFGWADAYVASSPLYRHLSMRVAKVSPEAGISVIRSIFMSIFGIWKLRIFRRAEEPGRSRDRAF